MAKSSAVGLEWNALTYAGHTVWNVHNDTTGSGYKGGTKRRPREDWVIKENTHDALITTEEAEAILARLEQSAHAKGRKHPSSNLLTGILKTPQGESWFGNGRGGYIPRGTNEKKNRKVDQSLLEEAVLDQVMNDLRSATFIKTLTHEAIKYREKHSDDPAKGLRKELNDVENRISKMMELAAVMDDPAPALRKVEDLERHRNTLAAEVSRREQEYTSAALLDNITEAHVKTVLGGIAQNIDAMNPETLKDFLSSLIDRVTLDPVSHECQVDYRISMDVRNKVASPRGFKRYASQVLVSFSA